MLNGPHKVDNFELLVVDDIFSVVADETLAALQAAYPTRSIQRTAPLDLSESILEAIQQAESDQVLVLGANLSDPVSAINEMLTILQANPKALVIGYRSEMRGVHNSAMARFLSKPLTAVEDPHSNVFLFNRQQVDIEALNPIGDALVLELIVRGNFSGAIETPMSMRKPDKKPELTLTEKFHYLRHLRRLYLVKFGKLAEFINFGLVGASGFVIDLIVFLALQSLGISHQMSRGISFWPAVSWNWALNRLTTFSERTKRDKKRQWLEFVGSSLLGFSINYGVYLVLTSRYEFFIEHNIAAFILGIVSASLFNFAASTLFVYSNKRKK